MRIVAAVVIGAAGLATAAAAQPANLSGRYQANGAGFDGSPYRGIAEIVHVLPSRCRIVWRIGRETYAGACILSGTTFAASYIMEGRSGVALYQLRPDGALEGVWTLAGQEGVGRELLLPAR